MFICHIYTYANVHSPTTIRLCIYSWTSMSQAVPIPPHFVTSHTTPMRKPRQEPLRTVIILRLLNYLILTLLLYYGKEHHRTLFASFSTLPFASSLYLFLNLPFLTPIFPTSPCHPSSPLSTLAIFIYSTLPSASSLYLSLP